MAVFLYIISQIITDPTQILVFGFGSEILGVITYALFRTNVAAAAGTLGTVLLFLPAIYIALMSPYQTTSQSVVSITNWFVAFIQGLPASIIGDIGGMIASAIMGA
jgi:hypothetical protein